MQTPLKRGKLAWVVLALAVLVELFTAINLILLNYLPEELDFKVFAYTTYPRLAILIACSVLVHRKDVLATLHQNQRLDRCRSEFIVAYLFLFKGHWHEWDCDSDPRPDYRIPPISAPIKFLNNSQEESNDEPEGLQELDPTLQTEGPINQLSNDILIEILTNNNAPVVRSFIYSARSEVHYSYFGNSCKIMKLLDESDVVAHITLNSEYPNKIKVANICATEGMYCYEVTSLVTGEKKVIEQDFSENHFVICKEDETINFGDLSPLT
jgi:hypothetical protein